jgi:hypothetical protein
MPKFKQDQLIQRNITIQSQKKVWCFLNSFIIHRLVQLFNMKDNTFPKKIGDYIQEERIAQNYDISGVVITSEVYGYDDSNSTLFLKMEKIIKFFYI